MGCFGWVQSLLLKRKKLPGAEKVIMKVQKKWANTAKLEKLVEIEHLESATGGVQLTVDINALRVASRPPTRTYMIPIKNLFNDNGQEDAEARRTELLHSKLLALQEANKKREDCQHRKKVIDQEFRNAAMAKRQAKDELHVRAISRLQLSRPSSRAHAASRLGNDDHEKKGRPSSSTSSVGGHVANVAADLDGDRCNS